MASSLRDGLGRGSSSDTVRVTDESKDASSVDNNSALRKSGRNSTESPLGEDNEKSEDSVANLPPLQAEMLKRQTDVPEQPYGVFSLFRYASKFDIAVMIVCTACSVVSGAATPCMMIVFGGMQDIFRDYLVLQETTLSEFKASIASFVLYFVYIAIGNFVATYTSNLGFIYIGEQLTTRLREEYVQSCLRQNVAFFDNLGAGEVAVRLTADINIIQQGISEKVGLCMAAISTLISGFAIGFAFSWKLTLILLSTLVALTLNTTLFTLYFSKFTTPMAVTAAQSSSVSEETLAAIRLTTALGVQRRFVDRYDSHLVAARAAATKFKTAISFMMASAMAILWLNYGLGFWQGSTLLRRGEASLHSVITTMMAVTLSVSNAGTVAPSVQAFAEAGGRCSKIFNIIDRQSTLDPSSESGDKMGEVSGHLQFRDVKHVYPSRPGVVVMDGVSIDFPSRKTTAIVGSSGSGKSTVASLLLRLYDPLEGNISLDGADISTLNLGWLRRQIGYVSQEPTLFATSILENIGYGLVGTEHEHSGREERYNLIVEAAKQANAHEFISKLPEAYETNVGQRGSLLSGGQKQRIAIARAIVSDPKILLLDEATSALDTKSEIAIQSALDRVTRNRTTITIAHRLSTIRDAHQVVVLSGGCVVEHGTHAELVEKRGHLFDLLEAQKLGQQPAGNQLHTKEEVESDDDALFRAISKQGAHETTEDITTQSEKLTTSTLHLLRFLFIFNKDDKGILLGALVGCIICGLAMPTHSFFFAKQMIVLPDFGIRGAPWDVQERSDFWSLMYLMLGFVQFLSNAVQAIALAYCAEKATRNLRKEAFQHILAQDMSYFDQLSNSPGALTAFLGVDTTQAASIVGSTLGNIIISLTNVIASVAVAVSFGWKLGLVCFSMVPLLFLSGFFQFWLQFKYHERIGKTHTDSAAFASEYISAMPVVASLCLEGKVAGQYGASLAAQKRQSIISVAKSSVLYAASLSMIFLCLGLGFWYGSTLLATFEYNTFQLFICLMAVVFGAQAAGSFCTYFPDIVRSRYSAIQLKALFERQPTVDHRRGSGQRLQEVQGRVEFHNVSFQYGEGRPVLQKLNLTVQPNQHVGIVGPSGSGKSTLISLMQRFYDPTEGKITVDGHDISTLNVNQYRGTIGLVNQQPTLFQGTIRENLLMGSSNPGEEVSEATIRKACQDANIYDFIISLPDGFDTLCGIGGTLLSGGQKQRIAIARALVRSPRILLLDEATSALDSESEHVVQVALQNSVQGRTTISIAHRLSTIQHADAIHVLDGGTVVESGSHEELMRRGGRYAEMVRLQSTSSTT